MRKQDIEITISPTGEVSFTIKGAKGPQCLEETKFLEEALGGKVLVRERTTEYYEETEASTASAWAGTGEDPED